MRKIYRGRDIEVSFDLDVCIHVGECLRGDPKVFQLRRRPWVLPDEGGSDVIARVVEMCPSGALQYRRLDGKPQESHAGRTTVTPMRDGPLLVVGEIQVARDDGTVETLPRATLCRCGESEHKPFCDNRHLTTGFRAPGIKFKIHLSPVRLELDRPMVKADDPRASS
ncbi:MAG TPA: (4Fe-4S)-binding protein [Candidatus Limnocylindrales bacterium]|nr:(4Fe-4S)-binding protein [Candidatus Limnocylindrales bacterium]